MIVKLPWEKNSNGTSAFLKKRLVKKINSSLLKSIARFKMTDVTLIRAIFNEIPISFEAGVSVFVDSSTYMEFLGAYTRAFSSEEDEEEVPGLHYLVCLISAYCRQTIAIAILNDS